MGFASTKIKKAVKLIKTVKEFGCEACPRNMINIRSPKMEPTGSKEPILYIVGESPGNNEDYEGYQFAGKSGDMIRPEFDRWFTKEWITKYVRWNNVVRCFNNNITPNNFEIRCCKPSIVRDIERSKPLIIVGFGAVPLKSFIDKEKITLWRGRRIPIKVGNHSCWYMPMFHPSYIMRNRGIGHESEIEKIFKKDIEKVYDYVIDEYKEPIVIDKDYDEGINTFQEGFNIDALFSLLRSVFNREEYIAVDIETNKLKPYYPDSKILSVAVSNYKDTIVFPVSYKEGLENEMRTVLILKELHKFFLEQKNIIAHNLKFELEWFFQFFKSQDFMRKVQWHDSMLQAYLIDERTTKEEGEGMFNLGCLCLQRFGFNLKELTDLPKDNLESVSLDKLLKYNGMDAKYTHKLFLHQKYMLPIELDKSYLDLVNTTTTLVVTQNYGLKVDEEKLNNLYEDYKSRLLDIDAQIQNRPEVKKFCKEGKVFNPNSPKHLVSIFENILKIKKIKATAKEGYSVDNEVLKILQEKGIVLADLITQHRTINKLKSTYLETVKASQINGIAHPQFSAIGTITGRLSSGKE